MRCLNSGIVHFRLQNVGKPIVDVLLQLALLCHCLRLVFLLFPVSVGDADCLREDLEALR